jgi:hypothetical protein
MGSGVAAVLHAFGIRDSPCENLDSYAKALDKKVSISSDHYVSDM